METYMLVNNFLMERNERLVCQLGWPWIIQHRIAYATLFVSATLLIGWNAYRSLRGMEHVSLSVSQAIVWQFVVVSLAFGVFVAMGDLARGNGVYSFIVQVVSIVCVFAIRPIVLIPAIAATFGLVIWQAARLSATSHGTLTNFISLGLVLIVACCVRYHTRMCDIRSQERLERYSFQDALTGLGNVRALYVDVQRSIGKRVNIAVLDTYRGHLSPDEGLDGVCHRLVLDASQPPARRHLGLRRRALHGKRERHVLQHAHVVAPVAKDRHLVEADSQPLAEHVDRLHNSALPCATPIYRHFWQLARPTRKAPALRTAK